MHIEHNHMDANDNFGFQRQSYYIFSDYKQTNKLDADCCLILIVPDVSASDRFIDCNLSLKQRSSRSLHVEKYATYMYMYIQNLCTDIYCGLHVYKPHYKRTCVCVCTCRCVCACMCALAYNIGPICIAYIII